MNPIITIAIQAVEAVLPFAANLTTGSVQSVITLLEKIIPDIASFGPSIITSVQNVISALQGSGAVTAEQAATLDTMLTAAEAALDAAAAADGLTP